MVTAACTHVRVIPGHWEDGPLPLSCFDDIPSSEWVDESEESLMVDIDLHRMQCSQCGHIGYYSQAARDFYEKGVICNIRGLDGKSEAPLPVRSQ